MINRLPAMSLSFILFISLLAGLIIFLYFRTGKQRGRNGDGGDSTSSFNFDSSDHCGDSSSGDCGGDGGGGD